MTSKYLLRIFSITESCMRHLAIPIYRGLLQKKKSAIQPIILPDSDATLVREEASSDSTEETEAFRD